jgi:iron complex outermembrane receptor protein
MQKWIGLFLVFNLGLAKAQPVHTLPVFTLNEKSIQKLNRPDSSKLLNISEKVVQLQGISFRSYGPGGLQTLSYRGWGASQLLTTWEGMPINSSMNGQTDVSNFNGAALLPSIVNQSSSFSGALSGQLDLKNHFGGNYLNVTVGSMGEYASSISASQSLKRGFYSQTNLGGSYNPNQYPYRNSFTNEIKSRQNAAWQSATIFQAIGWKGKNIETEGKYWFQNTFREIPGSLTTGFQNDKQLDRSHKYLQTFTYNRSRASYKAKILAGSDLLNFHHGQQGEVLPSINRYIRSMLSADYSLLPLVKANVIATGTTDWAHNKEYSTWRNRSIYSVNTGLLVKTNVNLQVKVANRADIQRKVWNPSVSVVYQLKAVYLDAAFEETTRYPTMNELFWSVGGNPNLLPERAQKYRGSFGYQKNRLAFKVEAFKYLVNNYLLWYPSEFGIWQAQSAGNVLHQGVELSAAYDLSRKVGTFWPELSINASFTQAEAKDENGFLANNRQLIFIPKYQYLAQSKWSLPKQWQAMVQWQWVGDRYIGFSGEGILEGYGLLNASIEKRLTAFKRSFDIGMRADNLLNKEYYTLPNFPMPLRSVRISITSKL